MSVQNNIRYQVPFQKLHVAKVLERPGEKYSTVVFLESSRFYRLPHRIPRYKFFLQLLKESEKEKSPICIRFTKVNGDTIESVRKVAPNQIL